MTLTNNSVDPSDADEEIEALITDEDAVDVFREFVVPDVAAGERIDLF